MDDPDPNQALISTEITPALLHGCIAPTRTERGVRPYRLPQWVREEDPDGQLSDAQSQPAGVRIEFDTASSVVELDVIATKRIYQGAPPRPDGRYVLRTGEDLLERTVAGGDTLTVDLSSGSSELRQGPAETIRWDLAPGDKRVEIWLPHNESTELVALRTDRPVAPVADARPRWVHHGSSISQGSNAESPTDTWPAVAAIGTGLDLTNLGLGGSALLDPAIARVMAETPADLITLKLGINLVNRDLMRLRAFSAAVHGYLDTIRSTHPETPIVVISPTYCELHEDTPGPSVYDLSALSEGRLSFTAAGVDQNSGDADRLDADRLTLNRIRAELRRIVSARAEHDPHLEYLDGRELYGSADAERHPLPDRLHPDSATHELIGRRFAERIGDRLAGTADRHPGHDNARHDSLGAER